ncbi:MAG: hypothetical protein ACKOWC_01195, partial [Limnohabitans sp.]
MYKTLILASSVAFVPLSWAQSNWSGSYIGLSLGRSQGETRTANAFSAASDQGLLSSGYCLNLKNGQQLPGQDTQEKCENNQDKRNSKNQNHVWVNDTFNESNSQTVLGNANRDGKTLTLK